MRKLMLPCAAVCAIIAGCHDDRHYPDLVIASASVADQDVHMSLYTRTDSEQTTISVYMHRHHPDGYAQYLRLTGGDALLGTSLDWTAQFTEEVLPSEADPMLLYYSAVLNDATAGRTIDLQFERDQVSLIPAQITTIEQTPFTVGSDSEPVDLQSTLHAEWEAISGYEYQLKFVFHCQMGTQETGFTVRYPHAGGAPLVSPFDLDLAQFAPSPGGLSNCQVTVSLIASQDQSSSQAVDSETLNVDVSRSQQVVIPLVIDN